MRQRTLARKVECRGIGLHGGRPVRATLRPAPADTGIVFRRTDRAAGRRSVDVPARVESVADVSLATTLAADGPQGATRIGTVEHVLAALQGLGVDNCVVEVDADELPILDGSSAPWVLLVREAGLKTQGRARRVRRVLQSLAVTRGEASIEVHPAETFRVTCSIDFDHPAIGRQECSITVAPRAFAEQLAPARTFGFLRDVEALRRAGLALGGSFSNAVVLDDHRVLNGRLRYADEFVRHKALDLIGDLALLGAPLLGHVVARRAGHALHVEFARRLLATPRCWQLEELRPHRPVAVGGPAVGSLGVRAALR